MPAWHLTAMRRPSLLSLDERAGFVAGVSFEGLLLEGDYGLFAYRYLMRGMIGVRGRIFYARYATNRVDSMFIREQLYISQWVLHQPVPTQNRRAKGIADSNDENPNREKEMGPQLAEEEDEEEVPLEEGNGGVPPTGPSGGVQELPTVVVSLGRGGGGRGGRGGRSPVSRSPFPPVMSGRTHLMLAEAMRQVWEAVQTPEGCGSMSGSRLGRGSVSDSSPMFGLGDMD